MKKIQLLAFALLLAAGVPGAGAQTPSSSRIDPKADQVMRTMAAFLAKAKAFTVEAEEAFDAEYAGAYRVQLTGTRTITVERPSHFATVATGDVMDRASWYDGQNLTVLHSRLNAYATVSLPGTIDGVLDAVARDYGFAPPLGDVLYADPYATLMADVLYGKYLGLHQAAGVSCHHLTFGQDGLEWQIWIDAGAQPLPRKLTIAYWESPDVPQYRATFVRWSLDPKLTPSQF